MKKVDYSPRRINKQQEGEKHMLSLGLSLAADLTAVVNGVLSAVLGLVGGIL